MLEDKTMIGSDIIEDKASKNPDDYAVVRDPKSPSTWSLDISDLSHISGAIQALSPAGFRGNKVDLKPNERKQAISRIRGAISKLPDNDEKKNLLERLDKVKEYSKAYQGLLQQSEVNYIPLSTSKGKACASCRWFIASGSPADDGDGDNDCHLVCDWPQPILPTGYCDRFEAMPAPPEPDRTPIPVTIVQPDEDDMTMQMERKTVNEDGLFSRLLERLQSVINPEKETQSFMVFKGGDGKDHWVAWYTNNFKDRDHEILSAKALHDDVLRKEMGIVPMPELWDWHVKGTRSGIADDILHVGHFNVAIGHYDDTDFARQSAAYDRKHQKEITLSHGFTAPKWAFKDGVYEVANTFEISKLPQGKEANPFTYFDEVKAMELSEAKQRHLEDRYGKAFVEQLLKTAEQRGKALEEMGVEFKDFAAVTPTPAKEDDSTMAEMYLETTKAQGELANAMLTLAKTVTQLKAEKETEAQTHQKAIEGLAAEVAKLQKIVSAGPQAASESAATRVSKEEAEAHRNKLPNGNDEREKMRNFMFSAGGN